MMLIYLYTINDSKISALLGLPDKGCCFSFISAMKLAFICEKKENKSIFLINIHSNVYKQLEQTLSGFVGHDLTAKLYFPKYHVQYCQVKLFQCHMSPPSIKAV